MVTAQCQQSWGSALFLLLESLVLWLRCSSHGSFQGRLYAVAAVVGMYQACATRHTVLYASLAVICTLG
jgi:hypothetical protein